MTTSHGRVCLVTGASGGIGRAVALRLSRGGHRVVLVAREAKGLGALEAALPGPAMTVAADLTAPGAVDHVFARAEKEFGPVQVVVCCAGGGLSAPLTATSDDDWARMMDVNLTAPFRCMRRALPAMLDHRWGRIVVIASVVAKRGEADVSAYSAAKHGVLGLVRSASREVATRGVTVNAVCPGYVDTPMTSLTVAAISERTGSSVEEAASILARRQPIGRLIEPGEVAAAVELCVDNGAINGQGINVDGGAVQS